MRKKVWSANDLYPSAAAKFYAGRVGGEGGEDSASRYGGEGGEDSAIRRYGGEGGEDSAARHSGGESVEP